jgi:hypothetical protein
MGSSDMWALTEIAKIAARPICSSNRSRLSKASKKAERKTTPAKTSGISSEAIHGRLVSAANTETMASRQ